MEQKKGKNKKQIHIFGFFGQMNAECSLKVVQKAPLAPLYVILSNFIKVNNKMNAYKSIELYIKWRIVPVGNCPSGELSYTRPLSAYNVTGWGAPSSACDRSAPVWQHLA